jgi:ElaA protein
MLRQQVFVVEQYCPYLDTDGKDLKANHLIGRNSAGELLAYARLLPVGVSHDDKTSIGRIVCSAKARGTGAGKELLTQSIKWMEQLYGKTTIKIGAQCYLEKFYNKFGFQKVSDIYLEDGISHIDMEKVFF